ncbi:zinc finger protein 574 [Hoplias malabaricus]|uniref:zinc finger protein 574 n=1 Tax=Hoplias malabaricus TaxID=27720 RepID=UPI0034636FB7
METSSVYMCFPCYREFPTLEEVLSHQLTCTAESSDPPPTGTPLEAAVSGELSELEAHTVPVSEVVERVVEQHEAVMSGADVPRVLYQCADCELLFDALSLWQQHRKMGCCHETGPGPGEEQAEVEGSVLHAVGQLDSENIHYVKQGDTEGGEEHHLAMETSSQENTEAMEGNPEESVEVNVSHYVFQSITEDPEQEASSAPAAESVEEQSPPVRRRGQKKPKPPSSLLCVECGQCFSLVSELVAHRNKVHGLKDAIHRCTVCGEGFINTTLFLYHRKQHRSQEEEEQRELPAPVPQLNSALLEAPGEGLLLLATAGEGQSLLEITSLEQNAPEGVPVAQVEVELDPENVRGDECQQSGQEPVEEPEETVEVINGVMEVEDIINIEGEGGVEEEVAIREVTEAVEVSQINTEGNEAAEALEAHNDVPLSSLSSGNQNFLCSKCGSSFNAEHELAHHRSIEHGLSEALHTCAECGEEFMSTTQFLYHRREHRRNDPAGLPSSPAARHGLGQVYTFPNKQRDIILQKRSESGQTQTSSEASVMNMEARAKLSRDWCRTPLPHECPHCGRGFTRRSLLREHVFQHTGQKLFSCHICRKSFPSPASLLRHSLTHGASRAFSCPICAKGFFQPASLKRHMLTHEEGEADRRLGLRGKGRSRSRGDGHLHSCPDCPASFNLDSQLQTHRLLHTSHPFPCNVCGEAFKRRKELDLHTLVHQDKEPKLCPQCGSQFLNQAVLDLHLQRCTGEPPQRRRYKGYGRGRVGGQLECDMCGHRCVTQDGLDLHRLSHTGQTPLRCPLVPCRRRFASSAALTEHVLAHCRGTMGKHQRAPRRYTCNFCSKEFAYASTFAVHMRTHTDERPFECTQCGKRFRQLPHLQDHERIHSGERPFTCWVCGKSFSVAARLTEHARVHSGERPYACPRCPTTFRSRPNLDKHMRLHDPTDPQQAGMQDHEQAVQTILLVQEAPSSPPLPTSSPMVQEGTLVAETENGSSVVFLHPNIPSVAMPAISMVAGQEVPHTIEFIIEETV